MEIFVPVDRQGKEWIPPERPVVAAHSLFRVLNPRIWAIHNPADEAEYNAQVVSRLVALIVVNISRMFCEDPDPGKLGK